MADVRKPVVLDLPTPLTRRRRNARIVVMLAAAGLTVAVGLVMVPTKQVPEEPIALNVSPLIVAEPSTATALPIQVAPADHLPKSAWIRIVGLPPLAVLSSGHAITPGLWHVPLTGLPRLTITAPAGEGIRSNLNIAVMSSDGNVLAEVRAMLAVAPASLLMLGRGGPAGLGSSMSGSPRAAETASASRAPCPPDVKPVMSIARDEDRGRAQKYVQRGDHWLVNGNVPAAREFYRIAADIGSSAGAFALAGTYDANELPQSRLDGARPDAEKARCWYGRARELAEAEASFYLRRLDPPGPGSLRHTNNSPSAREGAPSR